MKKKDQNSKSKSKKPKVSKNDKSKKFKKKPKYNNKANNKLKNNNKPKKVNNTVKKTNKLKESKLEYKKRLNGINRKNVSRILQACLKYGNADVRSSISQRFREGLNLNNLNSHSSKFLIKLFHYCNTEVKQFLRFAFFNEKQKNLIFSRFSSDVMDIIYSKLRPKDQISVLQLYTFSNSFYLNNDETRKAKEVNSINQLIQLISTSTSKSSCLEKMDSVITKLAEKELMISSLSHDLLFVYVSLIEDKTELVSQLYKIYGQLLSTRSGNNSILALIDYANAKIKKHIIKSMKRDFPEAVYNKINVNFLIKLVNVTDDTKVVFQHLVEPLLEDLNRLLHDTNSVKFVLNLLNTVDTTSPNTLKEDNVRKEELQKEFVPKLVEYFKESDLKSCILDKNCSQVLLHTLKISKDSNLLDLVLSIFSENLSEFLDNQLYQSMVKCKNKISEEFKEFKVNERLWEHVKSDVKRVLSSKSVFLLIDLVESFQIRNQTDLISDFKNTVTIDIINEAKSALTGINCILKCV
uniref:PUM-HD domain-containing protein n=1 Tax=Theileria annulata TaxID=5874 RepID=A0A3B0MTB5_THEAN